MKSKLIVAAFAASLVFSANVNAAGKPVGISKGVMEVAVKHNGEDATISRNQDNKNTVNPACKNVTTLSTILYSASNFGTRCRNDC